MPVAILIPALQLLHPMPGVITQGVRPGHHAIDIACIPGTPVRAAHDGRGSQERSLTHGITFVLHGEGGLRTSYSHLEKASAPGHFRRGDVIGSCGNTGIWSSGPHLHFESNRPELLGSLVQDDVKPLPLLPSIRNIGGTPDAIKSQPLKAQR